MKLWVQNSRPGLLSLPSCVSLGKSFDNTEPQFHSSPNSMIKHPLVRSSVPQAQACFQIPHCGNCLLHCLTRTEYQTLFRKILHPSTLTKWLEWRLPRFWKSHPPGYQHGSVIVLQPQWPTVRHLTQVQLVSSYPGIFKFWTRDNKYRFLFGVRTGRSKEWQLLWVVILLLGDNSSGNDATLWTDIEGEVER